MEKRISIICETKWKNREPDYCAGPGSGLGKVGAPRCWRGTVMIRLQGNHFNASSRRNESAAMLAYSRWSRRMPFHLFEASASPQNPLQQLFLWSRLALQGEFDAILFVIVEMHHTYDLESRVCGLSTDALHKWKLWTSMITSKTCCDKKMRCTRLSRWGWLWLLRRIFWNDRWWV